MKRRIFIAINLPPSLKGKLAEFKEKYVELPGRWTKKDSLHLTLVFIGYADEGEIYEVCKVAREVAQASPAFSLNFEKISYGPPGKFPRMIWLNGRASVELAELKKELDRRLEEMAGLPSFRVERRPISAHITLARLNLSEIRGQVDLPELEQEFMVGVPVNSIEVMESDLRYDGAEYAILESCPLGAD